MNSLLRKLRPENIELRSRMRDEQLRKAEQERLQRESDYARLERLYVEHNYSHINQHLRNVQGGSNF